jgi:hypothetical protein
MEGTPSEVGARAEQAVAFALMRSGRRVFVPFLAADGRLDLVVEESGRLFGVRCNGQQRGIRWADDYRVGARAAT